jgi:ADP-ribosylglycohydrolase
VRRHDEGAFTAHGDMFDIGITTTKAIHNLKSGIAPEKAGCAGAAENGNGSLMRIAPLVFYIAGKPVAERYEITKAASSITHALAWSVTACFMYLEYLCELLRGQDKNAAYSEPLRRLCHRYPRSRLLVLPHHGQLQRRGFESRRLPSIAVDCPRLPSIAVNCRRVPPISLNFRQFGRRYRHHGGGYRRS